MSKRGKKYMIQSLLQLCSLVFVCGLMAPMWGATPPAAQDAATQRAPTPAPATQPVARIAPEEVEPRIQALQALQAQGRHDDLLAAARGLLAALPPEARSVEWRIPFNGYEPDTALLGRRYGYFMLNGRANHKTGDAPDLPVPEAWQPEYWETRGGSTVTCVDLVTGARLWTRPRDTSAAALDPRDDALWSWDSFGEEAMVRRFDPATGEQTLGVRMPTPQRSQTDGQRRPWGIRSGGVSIFARAHGGDGPRKNGLVLDLENGQYISGAYPPRVLGFNRLQYLDTRGMRGPDDTAQIVLLPIAAGAEPVWSFPIPGHVGGAPMWMGRASQNAPPTAAEAPEDVLVIAGNEHTHGSVHRLDGATGAARWSTMLPEPAYTPSGSQLSSGSYIDPNFPAADEAGELVIAISSRNTLFFIDSENGQITGSFPAGAAPIDTPRLVDGRLVVATIDGITSRRLAGMLGTEPSADTRIERLCIDSLLATGRKDQALQTALAMTADAPQAPLAWEAAARAAEAGDDDATRRLAPALWARYMSAAGLEELDQLKASHGLLRRIPTAPITAPLAPTDLVVYAGTLGGELISIDAASGGVIDVQRFDGAIRSMSFAGDTLSRGVHNPGPLRSFTRSLRLLPNDPLEHGVVPEGVPGEALGGWMQHGGFFRDGTSIIRTIDHGGVFLLRGGRHEQHPGTRQLTGPWQIARAGERLLGFAHGGVWTLDENYRPAERLLTIPVTEEERRLNRRLSNIYALAGDGRTLCLIAGPAESPTMQLWSADGKTLLRQLPVRAPGGPGYRLQPLGDGYLFSGGSLAWMPSDAGEQERAHWSFDLHTQPPPPGRVAADWDDHQFGVARVVGDKVFVAAQGGGVYVFSVRAITGD